MGNPDHLALLDHGVQAWNAARRDAPESLPELSGVDLSQRRLAGIDLSAANLRGADLHGCDLEGADLSDSWLQGADFTGARLIGARLAGAQIARCRLEGATLVPDGQHLGDADQLATLLRGAAVWNGWLDEHRALEPDLPRNPCDAALAKLVRTQHALAQAVERKRFEGDAVQLALLRSGVEHWNAWRSENADVRPDLRGADLCDAALADANLSQADLRGALLARADLSRADLAGADLCEALLCWADLGGASLLGAGLVSTDLTGADLSGASLDYAECAQANFTGARLDRVTLSNVRLEEADFFEGDARQLALLYAACRDAAAWNEWRQRNPQIVPDLRGANLVAFALRDVDLSRANLARAHLSRAEGFRARLAGADLASAKAIECNLLSADLENARLAFASLERADLRLAKLAGASLFGADLREARFAQADLAGANLAHAQLDNADLGMADLSGAQLTEARLYRANLSHATLRDADLTNATLTQALMVETVVDGATLTGAHVYGVSAWGLELSKVRDQTALHITPAGHAGLTVDNLELAQFVYLMVHNEKIRGVIDTIGRKAVLILGRFYAERKAVLDALKVRLRELDLVPIVFDWDKPTTRDLTETVALLANMSRFVVADVTDAKSIPQELSEIVPRLPSVPVQPILLRGDPGYAMFEHWKGYRTMLPVFEYRDQAHLLDNVRQAILEPVQAWEAETAKKTSLDDLLKAKDDEIVKLRAMLQAQGPRK
jgi:uncharacterized protein YjbI with pentapeptide repeats